MWHGGAVGESSSGEFAIYCVPSYAQHVLKVYLDGSDKVVEIGPQLSVGQNKWYGGIKGIDGCIYGMPYTATGVLRINPKDDSVDVLGNFPSGGWKWHGGLLAPQTGVIYAFPAHSNEVLCVDTNVRGDINHDESWRVSTIPIKRHEGDTDPHDLRYKWLGGSYGADDCIYGMPSDATTILRIDPFKNEATTFGNVSSSQNKFQGGVLSAVDKCVYAVPADASCVLKIDTNPDTPLSIDLIGKHFQDIDDKWQGAFVGSDNKIYAIPENINNVMIITPTGLGKVPCVEMLTDGETTPRPRIAGATVEYYDNDFSYEEHQMEMEQKLHSTSASLEADDHIVDDDDDERSNLHPNRQAKCWDGFHTAHRSGNFFKPRRYIMKCFPCILSHNASDNSAEMVKSAEKKRLVLEIGCGSGSSCLPILRSSDSENTIILACDCSAVAVDVCNSVIESSKDVSKNFCAFVSDPSLERDETDTTFPQDVKAAHVQFLAEVNTNDEDIGLADVVLMMFVLSAVPPKRVARFMKQICDATKCGGKVCFRDYALYDLPMMRLNCVYSRCCDADGKAPRLYERGDGTLSRFFNLDTVKEIFESAGFVAEELRYATVFNNNRKTGERLKRAFVHAVFRKPADRSVPIECFLENT
jgi:methyltransferase-like protein 6